DTMASQLQALDSRLGDGTPAASALTSSEMQKLASLGYVGLQNSGNGMNGAAAAAGTDPNRVIAAINRTMEALADLDDGNADGAVRALRPVLASQPNFYLAQY